MLQKDIHVLYKHNSQMTEEKHWVVIFGYCIFIFYNCAPLVVVCFYRKTCFLVLWFRLVVMADSCLWEVCFLLLYFYAIILFTVQMECLNKPHVHVRDREYVERILAKMVADGPNKLQVSIDLLCHTGYNVT